MDNITTLGKILDKNRDYNRDAVHIAIMPVIAGEDLYRGNKLKLKFGTTNVVLNGDYDNKYIGIVDPFLRDYGIKEGQKFWMWLVPGTINSLRHEWSHPIIDKKPKELNASELWLTEFAEKWNFDYDEMIEGAKQGSWVTARGIDLHYAGELEKGDEELFWYHIEQLVGEKFDMEHKSNFSWSCSC